MLVGWYRLWATEKAPQNERAVRDREYYDGIQWTSEEEQKLRDRGQPVLTFNRIGPKINYMLGYEIETRVDPEAYPRSPAHEDARGVVTDSLRYLDDHLDFDRMRSFATEDLFIQGACGCVVGWDGKDITTKRVPWRQLFYDPRSTEPDFSDAAFLGVACWWNLDDALADEQYGQRPEVLRESASTNSANWPGEPGTEDIPELWSDSTKQRLKICEVYWREAGVWWLAHYSSAGMLVDPQPCEYMTDSGESYCPLIATSCFVGQDGAMAGERYGIARPMISPQDEVNHRRSRALHAGNMYGAIFERGAIRSPREFLGQLSRPDCMAMVEADALASNRVIIRDAQAIEQANLTLLAEAKEEIDATGPSAPVVAGDDSVLSGRAIMAKQSIGSREIRRPLDNLRNWQLRVYKAWWWMVRQYWTEEMFIRVNDSKMREGYRFVALNQPMSRGARVQELVQKGVPWPSAVRQVGIQPAVVDAMMTQATQMAQRQVQMQMQQVAVQTGGQVPPQMQQQAQAALPQIVQQLVMSSPQMQEIIRANEMAQLEMDIVIDAVPDTTIAAHEEMMDLVSLFAEKGAGAMPPPFLKVLIENSNLRSKGDLIEAISKPQNPEQAQMQQAQMQLAIQTMQAQLQHIMSQVELNKAKIASEQAGAMKDVAQAQIGIPAEATKDQGVAMSAAASAGEKTVPMPDGGGQLPPGV